MEISNDYLIMTAIIIVVITIMFVVYKIGSKDRKQKPIKKVEVKKVEVKTIVEKKVKEKPIIPKDDVFRELKPFNIVKHGSWLDLKYYYKRFIYKFRPQKTVLVNIELLNGFHISLVVKEKEDGFRYKGKMYVFDNELKYYNISAKLWAYDFHENFSMPIKRKLPLDNIKKALETSEISEIEYMSNPTVLERFVTSKIAEGILKGQELDAWLRQVRLLVIIILLAVIIHLFLFMQKTGMLKQIKVPFG